MGTERRRRRMRRSSPPVTPVEEGAADGSARAPSPQYLAELGGTFAMTATVHDPEEPGPADRVEAGGPVRPAEPGGGGHGGAADIQARPGPDRPGPGQERPGPVRAVDDPGIHDRPADDQQVERGLRGLVGGGSSQVSVAAALRARDASRPTDADLAAAEEELVIVRRGWTPREDLPPRGPRR